MTKDKLIDAFLDMPEDAREDLALALGILLSTPLLRRKLRKKGASEWQAYVAASVLGSLLITNKRLERIAKTLRENQA